MPETALPRLLLTSPASGGGKTTVAVALLRALRDDGLAPAAFKCGPDYLDPLFHRQALGTPGRNLDLHLAGPDIVRGLLAAAARAAGVSIIEGAMGYYDGIGGGDRASAWRTAVETATPAVLVLRPRGACLSLAALVRGFASFRADSRLAGVILNGCTPARHDQLAPIIKRETGLDTLGFLPEIAWAHFPARRLGLAAPDSAGEVERKIAALAAGLRQGVDLGRLLRLARSAPPLAASLPEITPEANVRVAVAQDAAFCFYYRENLEMLQALGAELLFFSPLADSGIPADVHALYLGGGYPEMHAPALSANASLRRNVRAAAADGLPILAEGGGFLYLQNELQDQEGSRHPMCDVIPGVGLKGDRLRRFGYVNLTARAPGLLGPAGLRLRGHEFHYWDSSEPGDGFDAEKAADGTAWRCCHAGPALFAGFPQIYFWSNPAAARAFVRAAADWRDAKGLA